AVRAEGCRRDPGAVSSPVGGAGLPDRWLLADGMVSPSSGSLGQGCAGHRRADRPGGPSHQVGLLALLRHAAQYGPFLELEASLPGVLRAAAQPAAAGQEAGAETTQAGAGGTGGAEPHLGTRLHG